MADDRSQSKQALDLSESVAGEEDPGASVDLAVRAAASPGASDQPAGRDGARPGAPSAPMAPGDEAAPGTPGTGEDICRACGGSGRLNGGTCPECEGTGKVTVGI
ncbi:MAG TPA: hypothetical protein VEA40_14150, partial [Ramlibacter sp.]|nr:hypothetical protein [Ramlibacter sp.]